MHSCKIFCTFFAILLALQEGNCWSPKDCPKNQHNQVGDDENVMVQYIDLPSSMRHVLRFDDAIELCRICFDGTLTMHNETKYHGDHPHWIGVHRPANKTEWQWVDGTPVGDWKRYADYFNTTNLHPDVSYGVFMVKFLKKVFWSAIQHGGTCASKKVSDEFREAMYFEFDNCGYNPTDNIYMTCQRPRRPTCHYWNYTDNQCRWNPQYGSHNYISYNFAVRADDSDKTCKPPEHRRSVFQCKDTDTNSCPVTEWSNWSECEYYEYCEEPKKSTTRSRKKVEGFSCPLNHYYPHLFERKLCSIEGCENLKAN